MLSEPDELRKEGSWSDTQEQIDRVRIDAVHDRELMQQLAQAIRKRV